MPKCLVLLHEELVAEIASTAVKLVKANPNLEMVLLYAATPQESVPSLPGVGWLVQEELGRQFQLRADEVIGGALAIFRAAGVGARSLVLAEEPVRAVERLVASDPDYALVVVGDWGTRSRWHYVLSSEVYHLSHTLALPLLVVKTPG
ncbi:hypothetical protein [Desulfothermobacter acidiphilus]|uniref:hypothetical protein n=1 Tax=Desulfothermobacter acidiphilus TaxID=1938353 RepID=UPI003F8A90AD